MDRDRDRYIDRQSQTETGRDRQRQTEVGRQKEGVLRKDIHGGERTVGGRVKIWGYTSVQSCDNGGGAADHNADHKIAIWAVPAAPFVVESCAHTVAERNFVPRGIKRVAEARLDHR